MPKLHLLVRCALSLALIAVPLAGMDQWFYDVFFRLRGQIRPKSNVILVKLNESRLMPTPQRPRVIPKDDPFLKSRPLATWHADTYEILLKKIRQGNPELVAFANYYERVELKKPLGDQQGVVFSSIIDEDNRILPPSPLLTTGENYGFANLFPDRDNVVRRTRLIYSFGSSLPLRIYLRLRDEPIKRNLLEPLWIDFRGPRMSYPTVEAVDVLDGQVDPETFAKKIVIVGRDEGYPSFLETPFGKMSRLEVQANAIDTFLQSRDIRYLPGWVSQVTALAAVLTSIAIIILFPLTVAWVFLVLLAALLFLLALLFFAQFKVWAGIASPIFCIFGTHLIILGYKLRRQEEKEWKFKQESETLKEMDQFKNNFISLFSHDLKTPISKIRAIVERLVAERKELAPEVVDSLKTIDKTNTELARLITDILKVTKMEAMAIEPTKDVVDLNRLVSSAVSRLRFLADEKQIELVQDLEPLFSMDGDPVLIQEVITNLVENAIKYGKPATKVIVRTREEADGVRVTVIDEGVGIPADEIPRVTGKFYRGKGVTDTTKGSGLGLYLSKYFIELHEGRMQIESEVGRGTQVSFWLPVTA